MFVFFVLAAYVLHYIGHAGKDFYELRSSRIQTRNTHGTGCTMASCIASELAKGSSMLAAVKVYKYLRYFFDLYFSYVSGMLC